MTAASHTRQRLQILAPRIRDLGDRALCELLFEIATSELNGAGILSLVEAYATRLSPEMLRMVGGDMFPSQLSPVPDDRRAA
ncbi:MAG: hypothetical protein ACRYHQ_35835 [Janthinobacterium lividum]